MANWLKTKFGWQLSHGSENEDPQSFEEAFQQQSNIADPYSDPGLQQQFDPGAYPDPYGDPELQQQLSYDTGPGASPYSAGASPYGVEPSPGASEMRNAYQVSNMLVRERLERENPENIAILDSIKDSDLVCVKGTYDHIHLVLEAIGVPFIHINPGDLKRVELRPEQTVYVNCPSSFPCDAAMKLQTFVRSGGQLITTDWALKHVLEVAFPGMVRYSGTATGDEVVAVEIADQDDEIIKGFMDQEKDASPVWWLESSSYPIEIIDKEKVRVLVRSDELKKKYKHDPVIISFEWGKGVVYHMISHFYLQRSETRTQKQGLATTAYASAQGASKTTMDIYEQVQIATPDLNYGMVQSAATSSEFVTRGLVNQKRKFASKLK